jgi:hypothetical protein
MARHNVPDASGAVVEACCKTAPRKPVQSGACSFDLMVGPASETHLPDRGVHANVAREYRLARLPRYVWVVEAIDRQLRSPGSACVLGEAVLDATSSDHSPEVLSLHIHGVMWLQQTSGAIRFPIFGDPTPYARGGVGSP